MSVGIPYDFHTAVSRWHQEIDKSTVKATPIIVRNPLSLNLEATEGKMD